MENFIKKNNADKHLGLGILIVTIGAVLLLRNAGLGLPHWILSWHTIMLAAGLWIGYNNNFNGRKWLWLTIIGGVFTFRDIAIFDFPFSNITPAFILIGLGLYLVLKPKKYDVNQDFAKKEKISSFEF